MPENPNAPEDVDSILSTRLRLYGAYDTKDDLQAALDTYLVDPVSLSSASNNQSGGGGGGSAEHQSTNFEHEDDGLPPEGSANGGSGEAPSGGEADPGYNSIATRQQTSSDKDVWDRYPLKEAKEYIQCPACTKPTSTLRFALHLDKCMGIGTTVRSATGSAGNSSTRSGNK